MALEKIRPRVVDETGNYTFNNVTATGNLVSLNANLGNIATANYIKTNNLQYANGVSWPIGGAVTASGSNTHVQFNNAGSLGSSANFVFDSSTNRLTVDNITANGAALTNLTGANITGSVGNANFAAYAGNITLSAQSNITSVGTLTSLDVTGNITTGNANLGNFVIANFFSGSGNNLSNIQSSNITGAVAYATTANSVAGANVSGAVTYAATANAVAGANVLGEVSFAATANNVAGANVSGFVANANIANTAYSVSAANITGTINLANFATTANSVAGANVSGFVANANVANTALAVAGANVSGFVANANIANTAYSVSAANIIGIINLANFATTANSVAGANVSGFVANANIANTAYAVAGANVSGAVSYATTANSVAGANVSGQVGNSLIAGTVYTNAQPNITSVGTLTSLAVTGDISSANLTLTGNLTVLGTTTTVNSTTTRVVDPIFELGGGANGAALSADDNKDRGLLLHYYTGATTRDAFIGWDDSNGEFGFGSNVTVASEVVTFTNYGNLRANFILGNGYYLTGIDQLAAGSADVANSIANGTSNISTPTSGGNITVGIGGNANTVIFTRTGINVTGYISPSTGSSNNGIIWPSNPGGGTLDVASIKYYAVTGEQTRLELSVQNDGSGVTRDDLYFSAAGYTVVNNSTEATSTTDAPFQVTGGAGIAKKLFVGGNIEAGTNYIKGNGYYLTGVDQLAAGSADVANSIANGTSNINTPTSGGNITVGIGGTPNTVIFTSTGINVAGYATVVGNITGGNANLGNAVTANYFIGNGALLTGVDLLSVGNAGFADGANYIANGTSNINTPVVNGNITVSIGGVANTVVFTTTGMNVTGNITTAGSGGNLSGANYVIANYFTGNGSGLSALTFGNITTFSTAGLTVDELYLQATTRLNVTASGSAGYLFDQYGATVNPAIYVTSGQTLAFNLNVATHPFLIQTSGSANYSVGLEHVNTTGTVLTTASAQGQVAGTLYWKIPYGITGNYKYQCSAHGGMNGNIVIADANVANITVGTANSVAVANVSGIGNIATINKDGNASNVLYGNGVFAGIGAVSVASVSNGTSNITIATINGNITMGVASNPNVVVVSGTGVNIAGYAVITGNITSGNANLGNAVVANYFTGNFYGNANTVTTNAQPNITSVGTLTGLTVGNATANTTFGNGTITATGNIAFTGANVSLGPVSNLNITGGAANYYLKTDGAGALSWSAVTGGGGGGGVKLTSATSPPASGNLLGDQWYNTSSDVLYEYINDGTAAYWVDTSSPSTSSNSSLVGAIAIKDEGSNITNAVSSINFVGSAVTASNVGNAVTVTITADTVSPFLLMGA